LGDVDGYFRPDDGREVDVAFRERREMETEQARDCFVANEASQEKRVIALRRGQ
jgi:hypothetical protein